MMGSWRSLIAQAPLLNACQYHERPHPALPSCLAVASATQQPSAEGAGPPQHALSPEATIERLQTPVCTENLNSSVVVMESAKDGA